MKEFIDDTTVKFKRIIVHPKPEVLDCVRRAMSAAEAMGRDPAWAAILAWEPCRDNCISEDTVADLWLETELNTGIPQVGSFEEMP